MIIRAGQRGSGGIRRKFNTIGAHRTSERSCTAFAQRVRCFRANVTMQGSDDSGGPRLRSLAPDIPISPDDLTSLVSTIREAGKGGLLVITGESCCTLLHHTLHRSWSVMLCPLISPANLLRVCEYVLFLLCTHLISGAGVSTESGIPDYRSPQGSYSRGHKPMTHQEFLKSGALRRRFWARNVVSSV